MRRSAITATVSAIALLVVSACGPAHAPTLADRAEEAWKLYVAQPGTAAYENFIIANRAAAREHGNEHDATGVGFRVRALEVQAAEAERSKDQTMADEVTTGVDDIAQRDLLELYDELVPGTRGRLAAAKARAARVIR
jgi:hypothetical protein